MAKFDVTVGERVKQRTIKIEANDKEEALEKAEVIYQEYGFGDPEVDLHYFNAERTNQ
jgi:hypothetical protein